MGISILATTPTSVLGADLRLSDPPGHSQWESFDGPDFRLRLRLDADFDPDFELRERHAPEWTARSGDIIEFVVPDEEDTL